MCLYQDTHHARLALLRVRAAHCSAWGTQYPSLVMEVRLIADKSVFSSSFSLRLTDL